MEQQDKIRALVVDDDDASRRLVANHLKRAGYHVLTASNGTEAMELLLSEGPPIVVTDWVMPGMDGVDLCRAIRAHEGIPFTFIIIMTAQERNEDHVVKALDAGADDFVCKPVNERELLARLRSGERFLRLQGDLDRRSREVHRSNAEMAIAYEQLGQLNEKLQKIATTDELTGLTNRRAAMEMLEEQWAAAKRHGWPLSVIVFDIDYFKSFNDAYGHAIGDLVLREVADISRRNARREERCCRIGGEEFLILCPNSTEDKAAIGAERIRRAVSGQVIEHDGLKLNVSVSLGVAQMSSDMEGSDAFLHAADTALYAAKDGGRNLVRCVSQMGQGAVRQDGNADRFISRTFACVSQDSAEKSLVLIADDDEPTRQLLKRMLESQGYCVDEAANGFEALKVAAAVKPDVILMDVMMPQMGGIEAIQRLKSDTDTSSIPVVMICARTDATDINAGLEAGADEYLIKPVNPKELAVRVRTMIRLRKELNYSNDMRGEQSRVLGLLLDFSHRIADAESLETLLESTSAALRELTCCRHIEVYLPEDGVKHLVPVKTTRVLEDVATRSSALLDPDIVQQVFLTGERQLGVCKAHRKPVEGRDSDHSAVQPYPSICAPLLASEHCVGVVLIADQQRTLHFTALELEYVDLITNIAAAAIHDFLTRRARDDARDSIVVALARLAESRDLDTGRHLDRVTKFCATLANQLRVMQGPTSVINDRFQYDLERAVPLHDIGKVAVPDRILSKPGPLRPDELAVMRTHAEIGAATIRSVFSRAPGADFLLMAEQIAHAHHEWHNGQGYPRGLAGDEIPLAARIVAVADVYDALTSKRVYKEAMSHEQAVRIIRAGRGTQFDPMIVAAFDNCASEFKRLSLELADDPSVQQHATTFPPSPVQPTLAMTR